MNRKEKILMYLTSKEYIPLKFKELAIMLDVPKSDEGELRDILDELCNEGKIVLTKKEKYIPTDEKDTYFSGKLICNANGCFGFLVRETRCDDIFIEGKYMNGALNGDTVLVRTEHKTGKFKRREGRVIKVLERYNKTVTGIIYKEKNGYFCLRPDNRQIYTQICILKDKALTAKVNDRVAAKITEYTDDGDVFGEAISVLGSGEELRSSIEGIIISNDIKQEFDKETMAEADKIPQKVSSDMIKGRDDLRDILAFTVDGDDAKDFDDAVSLEILKNGNYYLGVHIADVSEYVKEGSALEAEAYERGTSVYLADRVIPMLPESLSNGICSLNPGEDRLTLSVFMEITGDGKVENYKLAKTVIRSKERMTYNNVNKILEEGDEELSQHYEYIVPTLKLMEGLAQILQKKRERRGAIQFDFPESRIIVDQDSEPLKIVREERGISNKMIEEFMIIANETVAEYAFWSEIPFIYRSHEAPTAEKIRDFNTFIANFGISIKGKIDKDNPIKQKALQQVIDAVKGSSHERIISTMMLHSLMKARYGAVNYGHFGLAAKYYCHFTSPIRRYPDLAIHRILKAFIDGFLTADKISYLRGYTAAAGMKSSECEINAEYTERAVDDLMKAAYMSKFIGESYDAVVVSVMRFGMFVEIEGCIEGLIRLENLTDDYYEFDEKRAVLIGKRKNKIYSAGDNVRVTAAHTDINLRRIDFVLEKDYEKFRLKNSEKNAKNKTSKNKSHKKYKRKKKKNG